jgi:prepilin-type N-terminal cleavage/methylation domain-containing protein
MAYRPDRVARPPGRCAAARRAFTLVELLVVIALMVVLISMGIRAFTSLGKGLPMREAVNEVTDTLNAARQTAITTNANTRFVIITDVNQPFRYSAYGILRDTFLTSATGSGFTYLAAAPFQSLPAGVYFQADTNVDDCTKYISSSPSDPPPAAFPLRGQTITETGYRVIEFTPTGNTLTSNEENLMVLGRGSAPGTLLSDQISPDKATIFVGASTGRVKLQTK